ncbi:hypothetical protein, partial [Vibrio sinaloensis]|uniref:hypothetical protein n=1 Tax=Photobacterium sp. (strain ATCC 43367) TaxID=379097 RepID=UPI0022AE63CE
AHADLRMGLPVALIGANRSAGVLITSAETLSAARLSTLRSIKGDLSLTVTARRAETLKARVYDGDLARITLPATADLAWVHATAAPEGDLM